MIESVPVAVVVPVYNRRLKLINTLRCVTLQSRRPALLIVVDDGSSDQTAEAAESWLTRNASFNWRVIRQSNAGVAAARNAGFAEIGELPFVCFLDSDDLWPHEFVAEGVRALEGRDDAVAAIADRVCETAGVRGPEDDMRLLIPNPLLWIICRDGGILSCTLIRSSAVRAAGLFVPGMLASEDSDFLFRLFQQGAVVRSDARPVRFIRRAPLEPTEAPNLSSAFPDLPYRWACHLQAVLPKLPKSLLEEHHTLIRAAVSGCWARSAFSCRGKHTGRAIVSLLYALWWDHNWRRRGQLIGSFCTGNKSLLSSFRKELLKFRGGGHEIPSRVDRCRQQIAHQPAREQQGEVLTVGGSGVKLAKGDHVDSARRILDRAKWHQPLCAIIVTHHNYSDLVEDALLSVLEQTYPLWECVVVDDYSTEDEHSRLRGVIEGLCDNRIRLIQSKREPGQIEAFFAGLAYTAGEFVSPLDPDDRLHPSYLEEMIKVHLNETVFCPIVCCEQKVLRLNGTLLTGTLTGGRCKGRFKWLDQNHSINIEGSAPPLRYFSATERGWVWTTTSAMMVRRSATNFMVPTKRLAYKVALDGYLGFGAHFLGGTIMLPRPLVYRGVHDSNDYIAEDIFSMAQRGARPNAMDWAPNCRRDVVEALFHNGASRLFSERHLSKLLQRHFDQKEIMMVGEECPEALRVWRSSRAPKQANRTGLIRQLFSR